MSTTYQGVTASTALGNDASGFVPASLIFPGAPASGTITAVQWKGSTAPGNATAVTLYANGTRLDAFEAPANGLNLSFSGALTAVSNVYGTVFVTI